MKSTQKRTAAVAPDSGYSRPRMVDAEGLSVSVRDRGRRHRGVRFQVCRCAARPGATARGRVREAVRSRRNLAADEPRSTKAGSVLRRFLKFVGEEHPKVTTITALTDDVWNNWRVRTPITPSGWNGSSVMLRTLLRNTRGTAGLGR